MNFTNLPKNYMNCTAGFFESLSKVASSFNFKHILKLALLISITSGQFTSVCSVQASTSQGKTVEIGVANEPSIPRYRHMVSGSQPQLSESRDYPAYLLAFKAWVEGGTSTVIGSTGPSCSTAPSYRHQVEFKREGSEDDSWTHTTSLIAKRYFQHEERVDIYTYPLAALAHVIKSTWVIEQDRELFYEGGTLYKPVEKTVSYERPSLEGIEGLEQLFSYEELESECRGHKIQTLAFRIQALSAASSVRDGYYRIINKTQKLSPYLYSTGSRLFLTRLIEVRSNYVNQYPAQPYFINYIIPTDHELLVKDNARTTCLEGFLPQGLYKSQEEEWVFINDNFETTGQPYFLGSPEEDGTSFMKDICFLPQATNDQVLTDIRLTPYLTVLNFLGRTFTRSEQTKLGDVLRDIPHLESLILGHNARQTGVNYTALMPILRTLTNLRHLKLGGMELKDDDVTYLTSLKRLHTLDLQHNVNLTDASVVPLLTLVALRDLNLQGCEDISDVAFRRLQDQIPDVIGDPAYTIAHSCLFDAAKGAHLYKKNYPTQGSTTTFTLSMWLKRNTFNSHQVPFRADSHNQGYFTFVFGDWQTNKNNIRFCSRQNNQSNQMHLDTPEAFTDTSWMHVVISADSQVNRLVKIFINNREVLKLDFVQGLSVFGLNNNAYLGVNSHWNNGSYFDGPMAEIYGIDGQYLPPDRFGKLTSQGKWVPIKYQGSYGTNGFHLDFSDSQNLGKDTSGTNNHWTPQNLSPQSQSQDTPTRH